MKNKAYKALTLQELNQVAGGATTANDEEIIKRLEEVRKKNAENMSKISNFDMDETIEQIKQRQTNIKTIAISDLDPQAQECLSKLLSK